ncbi:hypothetical protein [Bradyrhizobium diversitatis]|uniref:Uncharacterized protein n=1 Tax=Bradyrhizobium diversitatis TaxID=2755406 RepID=A0ABS0PFD0_9BRAD|nr:hypothetical protein [Bradyrhizobium diversitatis]MBH5391893.1 hypothetical protein [Bradyrhizobium diversitatis]
MIRYETTRVDVEVDAPSGGLLLLNDVWHPWWRAMVDGESSDILRGNFIFSGVALRPGHHTVSLTFHPYAGALAELQGQFRHTH